MGFYSDDKNVIMEYLVNDPWLKHGSEVEWEVVIWRRDQTHKVALL